MTPGKYLIFSLGSERFGLPLESVEQVMTRRPILRIPNTLQAVLGVFELKGETLPVIDTRLLLGLPEGSFGWFLVISDPEIGIRAAFVADRIDKIVDLSASEIESSHVASLGVGETGLDIRDDAAVYLLKLSALESNSSGLECGS